MVRRQSAPRLEFEAAAIYEYPEHLRPFLSEAPALPGVYIFHSESDTLPLYIGKKRKYSQPGALTSANA